MRRSRRTHENPAFRRGFLKNAVHGLTALMALAALSALLIAAVRVLLLLLAGLVLPAALLLASRVGLLLTSALRIVLILVRIGHGCLSLLGDVPPAEPTAEIPKRSGRV